MDRLLEAKTAALFLDLRLFLFIATTYLLATILYTGSLITGSKLWGKRGSWLLLSGTLLHTCLIGFRWWEASRPPFQTLYESLSWFAWCGSATFLLLLLKKPRIHLSGLPVSFLSAGAMFFAFFTRNPSAPPLSPPLQSPWFLWHVIIAFMSYAVFVVSCSVEITCLYTRRNPQRWGLNSEEMDMFHEMAYRLAAVGFPLLTFAIVSGAAWANDAWGRFWSWDPKETWSLITWTVFAIYIHVMGIPRWRDKYGPYINILGFICMIMTFLGINWLSKLLGIPSMHVYAV